MGQTDFAIEALSAPERFEMWRTLVQPMFDVSLTDPDALTYFEGAATTALLGDGLLATTGASAQAFSRDKALIEATGWDHIAVQIYTQGGFAGTFAGDTVSVSTGDVNVLDLGQTFETRANEFANLTLIIPRERAGVLRYGAHHGHVMKGGHATTEILATHLRQVAAHADQLSMAEAVGCMEVAVSLISQSDLREAGASMRAAVRTSLRSAVLDYLERNLDAENLSPARIAARFHVSRATLYRLFEADGGIARLIQTLRLERAFDLLSRSTPRRLRIADVMDRIGWSDAAHFSHAFKARFGLSPRDLRGLALSGSDSLTLIRRDQRLRSWIEHMRGFRETI